MQFVSQESQTSTVAGAGFNPILAHLNATGGVVGKVALPAGAKDEFLYATVASGTALVLAGSTASKGAGGDDGWVVRTDAFGNATCAASGACLAKANVDCDDKNPCTADLCGAAGCTKSNATDGTVCGSGLVCKGGACGP